MCTNSTSEKEREITSVHKKKDWIQTDQPGRKYKIKRLPKQLDTPRDTQPQNVCQRKSVRHVPNCPWKKSSGERTHQQILDHNGTLATLVSLHLPHYPNPLTHIQVPPSKQGTNMQFFEEESCCEVKTTEFRGTINDHYSKRGVSTMTIRFTHIGQHSGSLTGGSVKLF